VKFRAIVADPPWRFESWGVEHKPSPAGKGKPVGRRIENMYATMEAALLGTLPIHEVCEPDCALFLWISWPMLPQALDVIERWGFTYKTLAFDWVKVNHNKSPYMGLGYWTRANTEPCLLATMGSPKRLDKGVSQVIVSGRGEHSEKPEAMYERIERLVDGPYLELFHRPRNGLFPPRDGWTFLGNEVDGKDIRDALREVAEL
jgi:N6-adenosine-specific RNA methylase IME4